MDFRHADNPVPFSAWDARKVVEEMKAVWSDIAFLHEAGALAGVAEILRERVRQVGQLGYTPEHDDAEHNDGDLASYAQERLARLKHDRFEGTGGYPEDERNLCQAGALAAAEIDRLNRMMTA
jgi:hypothetical protein